MHHCALLIGGRLIGGECDQGVMHQVVWAPFDRAVIGSAAEGGWPELERCIDSAHEAFKTWRTSTRHERRSLLRRIVELVSERRDELVDLLTREVGKPISWSRAEVDRLALTFELAADLVSSYGTESLPLDADPRAGNSYRCSVERFPIGAILCMTPYNWPFNLTAHKIAPALATGNTVVLKTSPLAPLSTLTLARLIHDADCPPGVVNAWNGADRHVARALEDKRVRMLSFTGSAKVGWMLKEKLSDRKVTLELGGDAMVIVGPDADWEFAVKRIVAGGYGYAGQVCIAVQHVLVHESIYPEVRGDLMEATEACPTGDPLDEATVCGPLISLEAAERVKGMVDEALEWGAVLLAGGGLKGSLMRPTLLENVSPQVRLTQEEVFGPVVTLAPYSEIGEAIARVNRSQYGIQTGLFTQSQPDIERAYREIETGGLIVNDYPTLRFDNMPYGGVKRSGFGREGVRYAMDEMTETKTLVVRTP
jgi:acyl-CoA reductase-like NAD-dependent aldehyde dehydrogenase